jgi:tetratricopeptide (TPR) repeat protein
VTPRERLGLLAVLAAALALRVLLVLSLRDAPYFDVPIVDAAAFDRWAVRIAAGDPAADRAYFQDPLYAYFLAAFYKIWGRDFLAVRLLQALLGTLGLGLLFEAVRRWKGYRPAFAALVVAAFSKSLLFFDALLLKDFLGVLAMEAALFCLVLERRWKWIALGACLGAGALVRGNFLLLIPAAAVALLCMRDPRGALGVCLGAALAVLPATVRNAVVAGEFAPVTTHAGVNLYIGNNPDNTSGRYRPPPFLSAATPEAEDKDFRAEAERRARRPLSAAEADRWWRDEALSYIAGHPGTFVAVTLKRLLLLVSSHEIPDDHDPYFMARWSWVLRLPLFTFGLFTFPLAAAGLYLAWLEKPKPLLAAALCAVYAASVALFFVFGRYRLPLVPLLASFAGFALVRFLELRAKGFSAVPRRAALVFVAAFLASNVPLPASVAGHRDFRTAHRNLGVYWMEQDRPADAAREFEAAAKLDPDFLVDPAFVWTLGLAYEKAGRAPEAAEAFRNAARLDLRSPEAPYRAGLVYFHEGMHERAVELLRETLRRDPRFAAAALPLAESLRRLRRPDEALEALEVGADTDAARRLKRAEIYLDLSMWEPAEQEARAAAELRPGDADVARVLDAARRRQRP